MAKAKVKQRKDNKGRVLLKGESQRKIDGLYIYTYTDPYGTRRYVYSKDLITLREKKDQLLRDQMDGLDFYVGGRATINMAFDRYVAEQCKFEQKALGGGRGATSANLTCQINLLHWRMGSIENFFAK